MDAEKLCEWVLNYLEGSINKPIFSCDSRLSIFSVANKKMGLVVSSDVTLEEAIWELIFSQVKVSVHYFLWAKVLMMMVGSLDQDDWHRKAGCWFICNIFQLAFSL